MLILQDICFDGMPLFAQRCKQPTILIGRSHLQGFMRDGQLIEEEQLAKM